MSEHECADAECAAADGRRLDAMLRQFVTTTERVYVCARPGCANRVYADGKFCGSHA